VAAAARRAQEGGVSSTATAAVAAPEAADALWREVVARAEGATWFHTPGWAGALAAAFPAWRPATLAWRFDDGNAAVLPALAHEGALGLESMLPGVYGGPLFLAPAAETQWRAVWAAVDALPGVFVYGNPFVAYRGAPAGEREDLFTHALDLAPGLEAVQRGFRRRYRTAIRSAARAGLEVDRARDLEDVRAYCDVYRDTLRRWGGAARGFYPERLFRGLFRSGAEGGGVRLALVRRRGEVVAGAWLCRHRGHVVYWHGAVRAEDMRRHAMHLLMAGAIEDACRDGARWFDFNPSAGIAGVERFKEGFGAARLPFFAWRRFGPFGRMARHLRRMRERVLRRCPL
jgi:Acetyltransferase (GNAT) domain